MAKTREHDVCGVWCWIASVDYMCRKPLDLQDENFDR